MAGTSQSIRVARVICIFLLMFVHVYSGYPNFPIVAPFDATDAFQRLMHGLLGRSSLPLLTIISGWLFLETLRPYRQAMRVRLRTLIVPMVAWNLLFLAAAVGWYLISGDRRDLPQGALGAINDVFALTAAPINIPLGFLRDLFVVSAISPLLLWGVRRLGPAFVVLLLVFAVLVPHTPVVLRTQIVFFFALGIYLHQIRFERLPPRVLALLAALVTASFALELVGLALGRDWMKLEAASMLNRICLSALIWHGASALASTQVGRTLARLEPFTFLTFCSHILVFKILAVPGREIFGDLTSPLYPLYFVLQPLIGYPAAIAIALLLRPLPRVLRMLNAGRDPWGNRRLVPREAGRGIKPV